MAPRILISALLTGATLLTAGCANSVLNDPEEMARRKAFVDRQQAGWDGFWGQFEGSPSEQANQPSGGSPGLMQSSASTQSQCRAIGGTWNTADNYCWRL
ncbi:hypothetical protein [Pelagibacterium sediminicola]|uniref:hypothetical protein n=1 Tax=Pelagibacterium sediminicola TaxID=2248761 RepID=UPI000E31977F|nr:hypothetical protein [Pelagibacterium sediminicola]